MSIPRIVLTGGPCAGKTSALSRLRARLQTYGRRVYTTSEASTLMLDGGAFVAAVCAQVGIPGPGRFERKYLARPADLPDATQTLLIEQTYLLGEHEPRVRKCDLSGNCTYVHTTKKDAGDGRRVEVERPIT